MAGILPTGSPEGDRTALVVLYEGTDGDNWRHSWDVAGNISTWYGVTVNGEGRVVKLSLNANNLRGPIPGELGTLGALRRLSLSGNQLSGPIPRELGNLTALTILYLHDNKLSGTIPAALGQLGKLETLDLSVNELEGAIPRELGKLNALGWLNLSKNKLTGIIPPELANLGALRFLNLSYNNLSGTIPPELGNLGALESLGLSQNQLSGTVPSAIWKLSCIKQFYVRNNLLEKLTDLEAGPDAGDAVLAFLGNLDLRGNLVPLRDNPWMLPPAAVVDKGTENIFRFYHSWAKCGTLDFTRSLKVVFVGAAGAGKTSLVQSIIAGRGMRTEGHDPSTVGVEITTHELDEVELKLYDMAGQVDYYGLHQLFLTEHAVYVLVWNAKTFEGLAGNELDEAIDTNMMKWITLLHQRVPQCTVMLVASHCDELDEPGDHAELFQVVESRLTELHQIWQDKRVNRRLQHMDGRMQVMPGVMAVSCEESYEPNGIADVNTKVLKFAQTLYLPPSWSLAREVLAETALGDATTGATGGVSLESRVARPWVTRKHVYDAFAKKVRSLAVGHPLHGLLDDKDIKDVMDDALGTREFSGSLLTHATLVFLEVAWLSGTLRPTLDHKADDRDPFDVPMFGGKRLENATLLNYRSELVNNGILRKEFASYLWGVDGQGELQLTLQGLLVKLGVAVPIPDSFSAGGVEDLMQATESYVRCSDLLIPMRLADEPTDGMLDIIGEILSRTVGLRAVWQFHDGGAPYGLPERVIALCHKLGLMSAEMRWRYGAAFEEDDGSTSLVLQYDRRSGKLTAKMPGSTAKDFLSLGYAASVVLHVAREFRGASWHGRLECGMHEGSNMYHLAASEDEKDHAVGMRIIPKVGGGNEQRSLCTRKRDGCTLVPDRFGCVRDVTLPFSYGTIAMDEQVTPVPASSVSATAIDATSQTQATPPAPSGSEMVIPPSSTHRSQESTPVPASSDATRQIQVTSPAPSGSEVIPPSSTHRSQDQLWHEDVKWWFALAASICLAIFGSLLGVVPDKPYLWGPFLFLSIFFMVISLGYICHSKRRRERNRTAAQSAAAAAHTV